MHANKFKLYRFSPIRTKEELIEAIKHTHFSCFELCKQAFGKYLPVAGNMGIFCHYDDEFKLLTKFREELTEFSDNLNQKYFRLHEPIVIEAKDDIPETSYTHLYIRKPDQYRAQVGDVDFVVSSEEYEHLKDALLSGVNINGAKVFDRPDLDMIELSNPDIDALAYLSTEAMTKKVRIKQN